MRVLLSGSTGFIGVALAEALRQRGDEVVPLVRSSPHLHDAVIDLRSGTIDASRLAGGSLEGLDAAVHFAGTPIIGRWTASRREAIRASRIAVGDVLSRTLAGLAAPPSVLVGGSAIGFYGDAGEAELDESSASGVGFLPEVCRAWEASTSPAAEASAPWPSERAWCSEAAAVPSPPSCDCSASDSAGASVPAANGRASSRSPTRCEPSCGPSTTTHSAGR
jgi:hypothetical protein